MATDTTLTIKPGDVIHSFVLNGKHVQIHYLYEFKPLEGHEIETKHGDKQTIDNKFGISINNEYIALI